MELKELFIPIKFDLEEVERAIEKVRTLIELLEKVSNLSSALNDNEKG